MLLCGKGAARLDIALVAVLWTSDTEGPAVLARRVADCLSEGVSEVRRVGVEVQVMAAKGLLQPQHLEQVVRREPGEPVQCALQLPRRQSGQRRHVGLRADRVEPRQDGGRQWMGPHLPLRHAPAHEVRQHRTHGDEIQPRQEPGKNCTPPSWKTVPTLSVVASVCRAVTPATSVSIWLNGRFTHASGTAWWRKSAGSGASVRNC
jgi:hypothetical protein